MAIEPVDVSYHNYLEFFLKAPVINNENVLIKLFIVIYGYKYRKFNAK